MCVLIYQFCIWEAKLKKKIHSFHTIDVLFREKVEKLLFTNGKIQKIASCSATAPVSYPAFIEEPPQ
jgi:hypothetical protein